MIAFILAQRWNTEIISADSRQVYKYLSIGTAKPDAAMLKSVRHHCIDFIEPDENFSAGKFEKIAEDILSDFSGEGRFPIVCGGTGLYIKALRQGILEIGDDPDYRAELEEMRVKHGVEYLHKMLNELDPLAALKIPASTHKRVVRALVVLKLTGESIVTLMEKQEKKNRSKLVVYCLNPDRAPLYERINRRVDGMIDQGLTGEVTWLLERYSPELNSLNTVGYKETISYLRGVIDKAEMTRLIKRNSRHYAKRQMTWFRGMEDIHFLEGEVLHSPEQTAEYIFNDFNNRLQNER